MNERIRKAKLKNPGLSRKERRQKKDRKREEKQRIAQVFAQAAGVKIEVKAPERPIKRIKPQPAWQVKQETQALGWAWKPNG